MSKPARESAPPEQWTLIRGARQVLTLRGASGPRRGPDLANLHVIEDGAVLIRGGTIEETGSTRRIENTTQARLAREIDVAGKVVMPAFAEPDIALAAPAPGAVSGSREGDISRMSRRRLDGSMLALIEDLARYGVLTAGAHTLYASDLQNTLKALRSQQALQSRPLRIRSIFSPPGPTTEPTESSPPQRNGLALQSNVHAAMRAIARKKLASIVEVAASAATIDEARSMTAVASSAGYGIRLRVSGPATPDILELAFSAGAIALIGVSPSPDAVSGMVTDSGCVRIFAVSPALNADCASLRRAIDEGIPVALSSGYRDSGTASLNPQFILYVASRYLGMSVEEAIVAATYNAACSLRLSHVTGSIEPGKSADLCVMDAGDYRELARRAGHHDALLVMRAGRIVYRRGNVAIE